MSAVAVDLGQTGSVFAGLTAIVAIFLLGTSTSRMRAFVWLLRAHRFPSLRRNMAEYLPQHKSIPDEITCDWSGRQSDGTGSEPRKILYVGERHRPAVFLEQKLALALFGRIKKSTCCSASQGFAVSYAWVPRSSTVSPTLSPRSLMRASED